jgi:hypothetical protein
LRVGSLAVEHSTRVPYDLHKGSICFSSIVRPGDIASRSILALDRKRVFDREGKTVVRAYRFACSLENLVKFFGSFERLIEPRLDETIQL